MAFSHFPCSRDLQAHAGVRANAAAARAWSVPPNTILVLDPEPPLPVDARTSIPTMVSPPWYPHHGIFHHQYSHRAAAAFPDLQNFTPIPFFVRLQEWAFCFSSFPTSPEISQESNSGFRIFCAEPKPLSAPIPSAADLGKKGN